MEAMLVRTASEKLGIPTEKFFRLAFEYEEEPRSKKYIVEQFQRWYYDGIIHPVVEDYILDTLAGRT